MRKHDQSSAAAEGARRATGAADRVTGTFEGIRRAEN